MMRIVIADDENLIRSGLRSMLSELDLPLHIAGEAKNGEELIEVIEKLSPDLVFADIRMPRMSGLQALQHVKEKAPHTNWVMLTGFADFEYAREALRLGAINYLLKPASTEDLSQCISEAYEKYRQTVTSLNLKFESEFVSLIHDTLTLDEFDGQESLHSFQFQSYVFYFDSFVQEEEKARQRKRFITHLQSMGSSLFVSRSLRFGLTTLPDGTLSLVIAWDSSPVSDGPDLIERFEVAVESTVSLFKNDHMAVTALHTKPCENMHTTLVKLTDLGRLSAMRNVMALGTVHSLSDMEEAEQNPELPELSRHVETISRLFADKDWVAYTKELALLEKVFIEPLFTDELTFLAVCDFVYYTMDCRLHEVRERTAWFATLHRHGEERNSERTHDNRLQGDLIQKVMDHVKENYMKEGGIGQIAANINVTPNYLSTIFHKRTGMTYMKFLTETRMIKAKELLLSGTNMKIQQVAEEVGYYSTRHFTKLFKDYFGMYPSEIREKQVH